MIVVTNLRVRCKYKTNKIILSNRLGLNYSNTDMVIKLHSFNILQYPICLIFVRICLCRFISVIMNIVLYTVEQIYYNEESRVILV